MFSKRLLLSILILLCFSCLTKAQGFNVEFIGSCPTNDYAMDVVVTCGYAFLATAQNEGLAIINIQDFAHPVQVGSYVSGGYSRGVDVAGNYALLADWMNAFLVIDINNLHNPILTATLYFANTPHKVIVSGNRAYVGAFDDIIDRRGLFIIDIINPANPEVISRCALRLQDFRGYNSHCDHR